MKHSKLNQAEIERISEATGKSIYEVIKEKVRDSSGAGTVHITTAIPASLAEKIKKAARKRNGNRSAVLTECLSIGLSIWETPEINAMTRRKVLALCRNGAKRDIFSPAEMKGIERFLGVNARPKAAQEVPR